MATDAWQQSILKTLAQFDVLSYPLTLLELTRFNELNLLPAEILTILNQEPLNRLVCQRQGLYCFNDRQKIIAQKLSRYRLALPKIKRAKLFARLFLFFPWIKAVAVYSSLSLKNSRADGDIDLFFITSAGRAWSARFYLNLFLKLSGLRPTPGRTKNKLCASYLVDENNLDLSAANSDGDFFYAFGGTTYLFLAGSDKIIKDFATANNWIKNNLPAWHLPEPVGRIKNNYWQEAIQKIKESILGLISETAYKKLQLKILPQRYRLNNDGKKVSLGPGIIKLHDNDKKDEFICLFKERYDKQT